MEEGEKGRREKGRERGGEEANLCRLSAEQRRIGRHSVSHVKARLPMSNDN